MDISQIRSKISETLLVKLMPDNMSGRFIDVLLSVSEESVIAPGQVLFKIDETNTDQGLLFLEGALKITRGDGEVRYLESPDIMGEVQLFTPQAKRTATVEVVFGGPVLKFRWHDLGAAAQEEFNAEDLAQLRELIKHTATLRERDILKPRKGGEGT